MSQNSLIGDIRWRSDIHVPRCEAQRFENGLFTLAVQRVGTFDCDEQALGYLPEAGVVCAVIGYISNLDEIRERYRIESRQDVEVVARLYEVKALEGLPELDGLFGGVIFDARIRTGYVWQSEYGMPLPLYYAVSPTGVAFSANLKQLLRHTALPRQLNRAAVQDFLSFEHVIPNASTLLQGIQKLVPRTYLRIDWAKQTCAVETSTLKRPHVTRAEAKQELLPSIEKSVQQLASHLRHRSPTTTLTGGWDTNVILWALRNLTPDALTAVTIDGGKAHNEIPATQQILRNYQQIRHITSTVETTIIADLPDMVWMVEGAVFENGMFLRYALARVLAQHDLHAVFLGACADQVMYPLTLLKRIGQRIPDNPLKGQFINAMQSAKDRLLKKDRWEERDVRKRITGLTSSVYAAGMAYHLDIEFLLKMHGLIFNGFGIQGLFPFLNRRTAALAQAIGMENRQKMFYKAQIRAHLSPAITQYFQKSGSVVDAPSLVAANHTLLLRVFDSELIRSLLPAWAISAIRQRPGTYYKLILQCAYLFLFQELILSGRYDAQFQQSHIDLMLSQMLETR